MKILEVTQFCFSYTESKPVLQTIDLTVNAGDFFLLCGPSGCGKTTLLRCMKPQVAPEGKRSGTISQLLASEIGFVFQNPENQLVTDTVRHELAFGLENIGLPTDTIRRRVAETALFFGMDEWIDASVHTISGGQKQLLNLAAVIAMRPKLLLLDEPVSQLDPFARKNFLDLLVRVNRELGIAVILSEHRMQELLPLADQVLFMKQGSFVFRGDAKAYVKYVMKKEPEYVQSLPAASRIVRCLGEYSENIPLTVRDGREYMAAKQKHMTEAAKEKLRARFFQKKVAETAMPGLHVDHIWFQYEKRTPFVLKGLELEIGMGQCHMILGGNGSGKTTLLLILGKRLYANRGKIRIKNGKQMPKMGLLVQNPKAMFYRDTVGEELKEAAVAAEMIEELHLEGLKNQHPYDISGGEQQRLGMALVLAKEPDILLLDEPTKGLDIEAKEELGQYLGRYAKKGHAVVCVTHDVEFAADYADVCSLLFEGEVLSTEPAGRFFSDNAFYTTDAARILRGFI